MKIGIVHSRPPIIKSNRIYNSYKSLSVTMVPINMTQFRFNVWFLHDCTWISSEFYSDPVWKQNQCKTSASIGVVTVTSQNVVLFQHASNIKDSAAYA